MRSALVVALMLAVACGDDDEPTPMHPDAGTDGEPERPLRPTPPDPTALPVFTPCPTGWKEHEETTTGAILCEPFEDGEPECELGAPIPGVGCRAFASCPGGEFADGLPGSGVLFVDDVASSGDGTRSAPFASIAEALRAPSATTARTIALGKGHFVEDVVLGSGTTLIGACAEETILSSSSPSNESGVVRTTGRNVEVRSLSIVGAPRVGVWLQDRATASLHDVRIAGVGPAGIFVGAFAELDAEGVMIDEVAASDRMLLGAGIFVNVGAAAMLREVGIRGATSAGIAATGRETSVVGQRVSVVGTRAPSFARELFGVAATARFGAAATFTESYFARNEGIALDCYGSELTVESSLIRDTAFDVTGAGAVAIGAFEGAAVRVSRVRVDGHQLFGMMVRDENTTAVLEHVALQRGGPSPDPEQQSIAVGAGRGAALDASNLLVVDGEGIAVQIEMGASGIVRDLTVREMARGGVAVRDSGATLERADIAASGVIGIGVQGEGATLDATDVHIDGIAADPVHGTGRGLDVRNGATARFARFDVGGTEEVGAIVAAANLEVDDLHVHDVLAGRGLEVQPGAGVVARRLAILRAHQVGLLFGGEASFADLEEVRVEETQPFDDDLTGGTGIHAQDGGELTLRSALVRGAYLAGILARDAPTQVMLEDVEVRDIVGAACDAPCRDADLAIGIGAYAGATMIATRFGVESSALCGLQIADAMMDVASGRVVKNPVGVCLQVPGYDMARLTTDVRYEMNGINLDSTTLPVPMALSTLGPLQ